MSDTKTELSTEKIEQPILTFVCQMCNNTITHQLKTGRKSEKSYRKFCTPCQRLRNYDSSKRSQAPASRSEIPKEITKQKQPEFAWDEPNFGGY